MLFYSPNPAFQVICSKTRIIRHPTTGDIIETIPGIWAKFGKLGQQYQYINPETSQEQTGAEIIGHYFDTELEAEQNNWDTETREMVERSIQKVCKSQPDRCWEIVREKVAPALPWPTYDTTDVEDIVMFATTLGLQAETIAYESENKQRPLVLQDPRLNGETPEPDPEDDTPAEPEPAPAVSGATITL